MLVSLEGRFGYFLKSHASSGDSSRTLKGCASRLRDLLLSPALGSGLGGLGGSGGWFSLWERKQTTEQLYAVSLGFSRNHEKGNTHYGSEHRGHLYLPSSFWHIPHSFDWGFVGGSSAAGSSTSFSLTAASTCISTSTGALGVSSTVVWSETGSEVTTRSCEGGSSPDFGDASCTGVDMAAVVVQAIRTRQGDGDRRIEVAVPQTLKCPKDTGSYW